MPAFAARPKSAAKIATAGAARASGEEPAPKRARTAEQVAPARVCGDAIDPGAVDTQALVLPDGIGAEDDEDQDGNEAKGMIRRAAAWRFKYNPITSSGSQDVEMHDIEMHDSQPAAERQRQLDWLRAVHMST